MLILNKLYFTSKNLSSTLLLWIKILLFIDFLSVALIVTTLSSYFRDAGLDSKQYSYISSLYSIFQLIGGVAIGGILNDMLSKRYMLLVSFIGSMISYALVGLFTNVKILFLSRIIVGLVKNSYTTATLIIAEVTDPKQNFEKSSESSVNEPKDKVEVTSSASKVLKCNHSEDSISSHKTLDSANGMLVNPNSSKSVDCAQQSSGSSTTYNTIDRATSTNKSSQISSSKSSLRAQELSQLSAIMSAGFIIGPSIGGILYKYDKKLPALVASTLFAVNIILLQYFIPNNEYLDQRKQGRGSTTYISRHSIYGYTSTIHSNVKSVSYKNIVTVISSNVTEYKNIIISNVTNHITSQLLLVLLIKMFITFTQNSMSYTHILHYYEDRFGIETYQIGFLSSLVMTARMIFNAFFVGPCSHYLGHGNDGQVMLICVTLLICTSLCEYLSTNLYIYLITAIIPAVCIGSIMETTGKTWLLHYTPMTYQGTIFSMINVIMSAVGILSPMYGASVFSYFGGAMNKGLVAAVHYTVVAIICTSLYGMVVIYDRVGSDSYLRKQKYE